MTKSNINGIPVYEALINGDDQGMVRVSLVDDPAVLTDFQKFSAQHPDPEPEPRHMVRFAVEDEEKRLVYGVLMRADFPIYRKETKDDGKVFEYYMVYKADTLRVMAEKYLKESRQNNVNLMHEDGSSVNDVNMVQMFIKDSTRGISPEGFDDIADGSLFAEYHVENDAVWDAIKDGTYRGFSLEGFFDAKPEESQDYVDAIVESTEKFSSQNNIQNTEKKMGKMKKIMKSFAKILVKCSSVTTDKAIISWDGDEDLKVGDEVYILDEEGNKTSIEDGDYTTEDGKTIVVVDGKVSEIKDADAEVSEEGSAEDPEGKQDNSAENPKKTFFTRMKQTYEATYGEKMQMASDAIIATLNPEKEGAYLIDAADDFAVMCIYDFENWVDHYFRYPLTWDGDKVSLGERVEVKSMFVPLDFESPFEKEPGAAEPEKTEEKPEENKQENSAMKSLQEENAALKAELAEIKKQPATQSLHEEFADEAPTPDKQKNKAAYYASLVKTRK